MNCTLQQVSWSLLTTTVQALSFRTAAILNAKLLQTWSIMSAESEQKKNLSLYVIVISVFLQTNTENTSRTTLQILWSATPGTVQKMCWPLTKRNLEKGEKIILTHKMPDSIRSKLFEYGASWHGLENVLIPYENKLQKWKRIRANKQNA
jgi:hypothetical protein